MSVNVLKSIPPSVNGVLTACAGQQISLTCSRDDLGTGDTLWRANALVNCSTVVSHSTNPPFGSPCGPFMFEEITRLEANTLPPLNSTAVANATVRMTNVTVQCRSGNLARSVPVDNISLCIVGESHDTVTVIRVLKSCVSVILHASSTTREFYYSLNGTTKAVDSI